MSEFDKFNDPNFLAKNDALLKENKLKAIEQKKEIDKLENEKKCRRLGIPERFFNSTFENFEADTPEKQKVLMEIKSANKKNIICTGEMGTGKTHLAMCLVKEGAKYWRLPDIFRAVRKDFNKEDELLDELGNYNFLIIDEIGRQKFSDFENNLFFEIIDRRYNKLKNTMLITNLTIEEFIELYPQAILDRLQATILDFKWESYRGKNGN